MNHRRLLTLLTLAALSWLVPCQGATNSPVQVIYAFTNDVGTVAGVAMGANGSFYGVTSAGGTNTSGRNNFGGIFVVNSNGLVTNIWFNGTNGATPLASLTPDKSGNFYGTASSGGYQSNGTIFRITSAGQFKLLASFHGTNGSTPMGPLLAGTNGWYYGTTFNGGSNNLGTVFCVSTAGVLSNVFSFGGSDGANPAAGLIQGTNGQLYGTTAYGGANGLGTMFVLTYAGALTNLCSFTNTAGAFPGGLARDKIGNFYGSAINGGTNFAGTIFKFTSSRNLETLFTFDVADGANPNSPLLAGTPGIWYGTTEEGGAYGQGTIFVVSAQRFLTDIVSFDGATNGAQPRSGLIEGANGRFYGTTSQGGSNGFGEIYELTNIPPYIITPPENQKWATNARVKFSVVAGGAPPLSYQWQFDGTNEINDISGATNASLNVTNNQLTTSGFYTVVVSNAFGIISASAVLGVPAPTVTINSPAVGARTNNIVLTGTASAFANVANVNYWITNINSGTSMTNSGAAGLIALGTKGKWSIANPVLLPGTNYITVQSADSLTNQSTFVTREFFYEVPAEFRLTTNGAGSISGNASAAGGARPTNAAMLNIGEGYTLTALPARNNVFSNWVSTGLATNFTNYASPLHFIMESNLTITANFVTNLFVGAAGVYNGLFYQTDTNGVTEQTAGMLRSLTVRSNGTYSGTLLLAGASYTIKGAFNLSGYGSNNVAAKGGPITVQMTLDWTNEITGSVSGGNSAAWSSMLDAEKAAASLSSAEYTVLLEPGANFIGDIPPGDSYMLITNHHGAVTWSGALADGTAFSQAVPLDMSNDVPVYASLYGNTGLLFGWLGLSHGTFEAATPLTWIKPAARTGIYTNGFTNDLLVTGSTWTKPPASFLTNGMLTITNASLKLDFVVSITNSNLLKQTSPSTNSLTGTFSPKTGLLKIIFGNGTGKATTTGYAAILGASATNGGYFVTKTNAGAIMLQP